ncbi:hypothetical protein NLI96_g6022 [Meripilus lineatus]|uniref:Translation initiation factor IF2/IF5 domain-containing protein n=1 Tax=Meripilus lineatus TaxID=2056292 RepID=A0AAD5V427_9APHY|nr:hypothetical protein NLI96_g6022 [Physisporinus lineatus]
MASEELLFDPSLKKRKKKNVAFHVDPLGADADPTTPAPTTIDDTTLNGDPVDMGQKTAHERMKENGSLKGGDAEEPEKKEEDDLNAMFGDLKKKKKKKKDIPLDLKKKKKPKKAALDMEAFEKELHDSKAKDAEEDEGLEAQPEEMDEAELGDDPFAGGNASGLDAGNEPWLKSDRDYLYPELLQRFYAQLHASNPALLTSAGKRYTIAPPQLAREGNKKTIFVNVSDICKRMHRPPEHVIQYMFAEMGTTGSVDGSGRLVIRGRFQQKQIEHVLRRYIVEYVTCKTCKSPDTLLTKENRIFFMSCESCGSRRSVNAIKTGFQAQVGKRSKNKTG